MSKRMLAYYHHSSNMELKEKNKTDPAQKSREMKF